MKMISIVSLVLYFRYYYVHISNQKRSLYNSLFHTLFLFLFSILMIPLVLHYLKFVLPGLYSVLLPYVHCILSLLLMLSTSGKKYRFSFFLMYCFLSFLYGIDEQSAIYPSLPASSLSFLSFFLILLNVFMLVKGTDYQQSIPFFSEAFLLEYITASGIMAILSLMASPSIVIFLFFDSTSIHSFITDLFFPTPSITIHQSIHLSSYPLLLFPQCLFLHHSFLCTDIFIPFPSCCRCTHLITSMFIFRFSILATRLWPTSLLPYSFISISMPICLLLFWFISVSFSVVFFSRYLMSFLLNQ